MAMAEYGPQDLLDLGKHLDRIVEGVHNLRSLPVWVQAAHSFVTYNPEAVVFQMQRWTERFECEDIDPEGRAYAMVIGAHRIHRFGAGPGINQEIWRDVRAAVARLEHPEDLAEGIESGPLEPQYFADAGHQRGEWPYRMLPAEWYVQDTGDLPR